MRQRAERVDSQDGSAAPVGGVEQPELQLDGGAHEQVPDLGLRQGLLLVSGAVKIVCDPPQIQCELEFAEVVRASEKWYESVICGGYAPKRTRSASSIVSSASSLGNDGNPRLSAHKHNRSPLPGDCWRVPAVRRGDAERITVQAAHAAHRPDLCVAFLNAHAQSPNNESRGAKGRRNG